ARQTTAGRLHVFVRLPFLQRYPAHGLGHRTRTGARAGAAQRPVRVRFRGAADGLGVVAGLRSDGAGNAMSLRSPLGNALGRGAARDGVGHWWLQRVTAIALIPLSAVFVIALLGKSLQSYEAMRGWLGQPWVAVLTILLVLMLAWHSKL